MRHLLYRDALKIRLQPATQEALRPSQARCLTSIETTQRT
jgi:hypothetical protein